MTRIIRRPLSRIFALMTAVILIVMAGCSSFALAETAATPNHMMNTSSKEEILKSMSGIDIPNRDGAIEIVSGLGFGLAFPSSWQNEYVDYLTFEQRGAEFRSAVFRPSAMQALLKMDEDELDEMTKEGAEEFFAAIVPLMKVLVADSDIPEKTIMINHSEYNSLIKLAEANNKVYYLLYNDIDSVSEKPDWTEEDIQIYTALVSDLEKMSDWMVLFPADIDDVNNALPMDEIQALMATAADGSTVDFSLFEQYDLTMVNIWATWCGPCVEEMPDLAELYGHLPNGANLLTICSDGSEEAETMNLVLEKCNAKFTTIAGDEALRNGLLARIMAYPTTVFVDRNGNLIGEPIEGALSADRYLSELQMRLEKLMSVQ